MNPYFETHEQAICVEEAIRFVLPNEVAHEELRKIIGAHGMRVLEQFLGESE